MQALLRGLLFYCASTILETVPETIPTPIPGTKPKTGDPKPETKNRRLGAGEWKQATEIQSR